MYQQGRVGLSSLKKKVHSPSQRVANNGVQINSNGKPFISSLHILQISHAPWDLNLAKYRPWLGSFFGRAIQVTKVCIHLPTHKLHISALEIGRTWSDISTIGEDLTLWATREYHWETWNSFGKILIKIRAGNLNRQQGTFQWRLFSPTTAQDRGMKNKHAPSSRTLGMSQLFISTDRKSDMLCTRYLQGGKYWRNS